MGKQGETDRETYEPPGLALRARNPHDSPQMLRQALAGSVMSGHSARGSGVYLSPSLGEMPTELL